jgi:SH3 domain protein
MLESSTAIAEAPDILRNFYPVASRLALPVGRRATTGKLCVRSVSLMLGTLLMLGNGICNAADGERWVTDNLEITMRTAKDNRAKIIRMLRSGTRLEVVETDKAAGYTRVRTKGGTEGWVLSRYLLRSAPARVTLPDVQARMKRSDGQAQTLEKKNRTLQQERNELQRQLNQLENSSKGLESDLDKIRRTSSNAIQMEAENRELHQRLTETERTLTELENENNRLSGQSSREWFVVGAGVVIFGVLLGLILPRMRWRRKSSWGDF